VGDGTEGLHRATHRKPGHFELAEGGTLFLDEIGNMPPEVQVKWLRVLQEGTLQPLGGKRPLQANVRVVAANGSTTHRHALYLDFIKQIGLSELEMFGIAVRVEEPSRGGDTAEQRIAVLRGKTKAGNFMAIMDCQRWHSHYRLVEQSAKKTMVTSEGKDGARHGLLGQGYGRVNLEFGDHLIQSDRAFDS
jgi:sigma54-dependent transcription regulator